MKKLLLFFTLTLSCVVSYGQCAPNPLYQDSLYNIWPDTIQNLPHVTQGVSYYTQIDIKTPTTLIEAASGDSSITTIDTLGTAHYVGNWPVDSMVMVSTIGAPSGIILDCNTSNCTYEGDVVGCANVYGTTNDPVGVYPITIEVNVYTHGSLTIFGFPVAVETDLYSATGAYETIDGYKIVVNSATGIQTFHQDDFVLFQNAPNPFTEFTNIQFNAPKSDNVAFEIIDMFGKSVYTKKIAATKGVNTYQFSHDLSSGIYTYSVNNGEKIISKRMVIAN
ncbi:MAG TPA: T9SS type A sorting domain-containing protein [Flavobacteriales bacterium]|nr:T9SS type A sorting domain-containing protein [Flavobacteriales bacterium]HIK62988.1 T9SS type A sorting domain-containing protein [Flavobacteriales bacterium]